MPNKEQAWTPVLALTNCWDRTASQEEDILFLYDTWTITSKYHSPETLCTTGKALHYPSVWVPQLPGETQKCIISTLPTCKSLGQCQSHRRGGKGDSVPDCLTPKALLLIFTYYKGKLELPLTSLDHILIQDFQIRFHYKLKGGKKTKSLSSYQPLL